MANQMLKIATGASTSELSTLRLEALEMIKSLAFSLEYTKGSIPKKVSENGFEFRKALLSEPLLHCRDCFEGCYPFGNFTRL